MSHQSHPDINKPLLAKTPDVLLIQLLTFLDAQEIPHCIVGQTNNLPEKIPSDIDIVVPSQELPNIPVLISQFCKENNLYFVQSLQHEQTAYYLVLAWFDEKGTLHWLKPDFCSDYFRQGTCFLKAEELLKNRVQAKDSQGNSKKFYIPSPEMAFSYYLLKKIGKKHLDAEQAQYLSQVFQENGDGAEKQIQRFWNSPESQALVQAASTRNWQDIQLRINHFNQTMRLPHADNLTHHIKEKYRKLSRLFNPTGLWISVLGVDGSGKSTIIPLIQNNVQTAFRKTAYYHLRPAIGRHSRQNFLSVTDPHGKPTRNCFLSILKLGYLFLDYQLGFWLKVYPQLVRSTFVVFDRYYYDLTVDPKRFRYGGPLWLVNALSRFIPKPDLVIFLDAPLETLLSRKAELPAEEVSRQLQAFRQLVQSLPNGIVVDASQAVDQVIMEINWVIIDFMSKRIKKRA